MRHTFKTSGVCSKQIQFDLDGDVVTDIKFAGGCPGNLKAISKLCDGMKAEDIIDKLKGNTCGYRNTSCADQFAKALESALYKESQG